MSDSLISLWLEELPSLLQGLVVSLQVTVFTLIVGLPLGLAFAVLNESRNRVVRYAVVGLVEVGRGAPALVLLYLVYYGLPQVGLVTTDMVCAVAALGYSTGAYTSEIFRSALHAIPHEQHEAALAVGLTRRQAFQRVQLPQALVVALPPTMGFAIVLFQGTSLTFTIAIPELLSRAYNDASITFQYLPILGLAGLIYAAIAVPASYLVRRLEHRLQASM